MPFAGTRIHFLTAYTTVGQRPTNLQNLPLQTGVVGGTASTYNNLVPQPLKVVYISLFSLSPSFLCTAIIRKNTTIHQRYKGSMYYTDWLIDWLFTVLRPAQEYFTYMETSPLPKEEFDNACITDVKIPCLYYLTNNHGYWKLILKYIYSGACMKKGRVGHSFLGKFEFGAICMFRERTDMFIHFIYFTYK
jgi:hypothetical protein